MADWIRFAPVEDASGITKYQKAKAGQIVLTLDRDTRIVVWAWGDMEREVKRSRCFWTLAASPEPGRGPLNRQPLGCPG